MYTSYANAQLELACRVGCRATIEEALDEGADINFGGSSPLITAILAGDRETVAILVELGADVSCFQLTTSADDPQATVDALIRSAPGGDGDAVPKDDPVDAKVVRAFNKWIRAKGLVEPLAKGKGAAYGTFSDSLKWIAAETCHEVVQEFHALVSALPGDPGKAPANLLEEHGSQVESLTQRYLSSEERPTELLKDYLKERKKLIK